ncbi:MAG: SRPBCC family protein [Acidimicrobiia bacterium]|nr:SRPBCC family protein [Acidimicrobiia bacterium]
MAVEGTVQRVEVSAEPQHVYEVALDLEAYPEWVDGVKSVSIVSEDDQGRPADVEFVVNAMIKEISYTLQYDYDYDNGFAWAAIPNEDITSLVGRYEFNELEDGGTEVVYALKVDPAFSVPGFLRRQAEKQIISTALRGLKKRAEESA